MLESRGAGVNVVSMYVVGRVVLVVPSGIQEVLPFVVVQLNSRCTDPVARRSGDLCQTYCQFLPLFILGSSSLYENDQSHGVIIAYPGMSAQEKVLVRYMVKLFQSVAKDTVSSWTAVAPVATQAVHIILLPPSYHPAHDCGHCETHSQAACPCWVKLIAIVAICSSFRLGLSYLISPRANS